MGNLKLTQREVDGSGMRGKARQVYIKPDIEEKALKYCDEENVSMSLLIRIALKEYLEKRGF